MKAYLIATATRIAPFGDHPRDLDILGVPLARHQRDALRENGCEAQLVSGLEEVTVFPSLVIEDDLFFTAQVLRDFLRLASGAARLVLDPSAWTRTAAPLQDLPESDEDALILPLWRVEQPADLGRLDDLPPARIAPREWVRPVDMPAPFQTQGSEPMQVVLSSTRALRVRHWVHLLRANTDGIGGVIREGWDARPVRSILHVLLAVVLRRFYRLALVPRGRGCTVHRTAIVEACRLGANVSIGAHAVVRGCVLGDGAQIGEGAYVMASVLGQGATVASNCVVFAAVLMQGAFCGHRLTQVSVLGREAITTGGGYLVDYAFGPDIRVMDGDTLRLSGSPFLGVCLGHRVRMGTGLWIAAGRAIPNDAVLVRDPAQVIRRVPDDLDTSGPLTVRDGTLEPL